MAVQFGAVPLKTIFANGKSAEFEVVADIEVVQFSTLSTSVIVKFTARATSSLVTLFVIVDNTGASFTGVTVNAKDFVSLNAPSVTINAKLEDPF